MKRLTALSFALALLGACAQPPWLAGLKDAPVQAAEPGESPDQTPPPPPKDARTVDEFDTTTQSARDAAADTRAVEAEERLIGRTIAALGNPAVPGFWLETPLVEAPAKGRVVAIETGETVLVDLIPAPGPEGAGSRISLAALRLLGLALTGLHQLEVYGR